MKSFKSYFTFLNNLYWASLSYALSDKNYIKVLYRHRFGKSINLDTPTTFNEKLNWLKLYGRNPRYTMMADKYEVKKIVADLIGKQYVVPCYGVWNSIDDIDFSALPDQFVIKATHDSSGALVCRDKSTFDIDAAKKHYCAIMKRNWFYQLREWVYKDIKPRMIVDKFLDDHTGHELRDYKFMCFNGEPKVMYCTNKAKDVYENFYDMDFNILDINHGFKRHKPEFERPHNFELMKNLAKKLSSKIPFVRVDFFDVDDHVYFGEFTFYDWAGMKPFVDDKWDKILGDWIKLPINNNVFHSSIG